MQKILFIIFFLCFTATVYSQGFNWQYSSRLPSEYPEFFAGVSVSADFSMHSGKINLYETEYLCSTFESGSGFGSGYAAFAEYWMTGNMALFSSLTYSTTTAEFVNSESLPVTDELNKESEYIFNSSISYGWLETGAKYRLFGTHLNVSASLMLGLFLSNENEHYEHALNYIFDDIQSDKRIMSFGRVSGMNQVIVVPKIKVGYDLTFGLGMYFTPYVSASLPLMSIAAGDNWRFVNVSVGVTVLRGFM